MMDKMDAILKMASTVSIKILKLFWYWIFCGTTITSPGAREASSTFTFLFEMMLPFALNMYTFFCAAFSLNPPAIST
jgi:hypothetical protein